MERPFLAFAFVLVVAGCGGKTSERQPTSDAAFPVGTYTLCASGFDGPDGNVFLNGSGFYGSATMTLSQNGSTVYAAFVDANPPVDDELDFRVTAAGSATLAGSTLSDGAALCSLGPGDESGYPAKQSASTGALTYASGTAFVSVQGTISGDLGSCGAQSAPQTVWIACLGGPSSPPGVAASSDASFPTGTYKCIGEVDSYGVAADGERTYDTIGGTADLPGGGGTLTVTRSGAQVTAVYSGDTAFQGTLQLDVVSDGVSVASSNQSVVAQCSTPVGTPGPQLASETVPVDAAALIDNGSTLTLLYTGTTPTSSACGPLSVAAGFVCAKQ
jgi:hypothetical protein